jgi:hypothetical protein
VLGGGRQAPSTLLLPELASQRRGHDNRGPFRVADVVAVDQQIEFIGIGIFLPAEFFVEVGFT